ncbi:DMT family transporter [Bordetella sp. 2513F-2]
MTRPESDRAGLVLMLVTILVWAGSWIVMKLIVPYIGPFDFVAVRYVSGGLVLFALAVVLRRPLSMPPWRLTLLVGLTQTAGFQACVQSALVEGAVGKVSLTTYTMPFWVVLFAWGLLGERPGARHWAGIALAALGLLCFLAPWNGLGDALPMVLGAGSGLCWGLGTVLAKRMFDRHAPDILVFTAWQMLLGGLVMVPVALAVPQIASRWGWQLWLGMAYIVIVATALGWLLWLAVVRRVPASVAGLSGLGVPVVAVLLAWLVLHEQPTATDALAMALILTGLYVISRAPVPVRPVERAPASAR